MIMTKYIYHNRKRTFEEIPQYIYQRPNGWFEIRKRIGDKLVYWGSYPTLEEAQLHKAYYIGKNWEVNPSFKANQHIIQKGKTYIVMKTINHKKVSFGTFNTLEEARHERDICLACNWDYDLICEWVD